MLVDLGEVANWIQRDISHNSMFAFFQVICRSTGLFAKITLLGYFYFLLIIFFTQLLIYMFHNSVSSCV